MLYCKHKIVIRLKKREGKGNSHGSHHCIQKAFPPGIGRPIPLRWTRSRSLSPFERRTRILLRWWSGKSRRASALGPGWIFTRRWPPSSRGAETSLGIKKREKQWPAAQTAHGPWYSSSNGYHPDENQTTTHLRYKPRSVTLPHILATIQRVEVGRLSDAAIFLGVPELHSHSRA